MPKVGTGYVEIKPDWSAFGSGFGQEVEARLRGVGGSMGDAIDKEIKPKLIVIGDAIKREIKPKIKDALGDIGDLSKIGDAIKKTDFSSAFAPLRREAARPIEQRVDLEYHSALERLRLALGHAIRGIKIDVDVDRDRLAQLGGKITSSLAGILQGVSAGLSGLLSRIPVIGGLFSGISSSLGATALGAAAASTAIIGLVGVLAALAASLGAALAGLGALTVAFAAALGPAVLVAFAALARFVAIVKAVKDHNDNASASARAVAAANDQLRTATEAVANAQANVREQTTAAYTAWADAIENVKDDLLGVKDAQQGITDASLTTREAQQAVIDYQKSIHAAGDAFDQVFKKFSDVNVDTSGLKKALLGAASASGTDLTPDQELHLERLINNVRDAKLGEAHATDQLKDSKRKLNADTKTEVDFAHRGIAAYKPYRDALKQVAAAQDQVTTAQRAQAGALEKQTKAWDNLSPAEQKFGKVLIALGKTLSAVFNPVMEALLGGVTRGLQDFTSAATDPKIGSALTATGKALGDAFASIAKTLTSPEIRDAFVTFAAAGARIIRTFGTKVFEDFALILTRIATATMPLLLPLLDKVAAFFDGLERSSRNRKNLQDDIRHLVNVFVDWSNLIIRVTGALLAIGKVLEPIGTGIVRFLTHPLKSLGDVIGGSKDDVRAFAAVFNPLARVARAAVGGIVSVFRGMATTLRGVLRIIGGVLTGNFRETWRGIKDVFRGGIEDVKGLLELATAPFKALGHRLGKGLINALIDVLNIGIKAVDKIIGAINAIPGVPNIGKINTIDHIVDAPKVTGTIDTRLLRKPRLVATTSSLVPRFAGAPAGGTTGPTTVVQHADIHVHAPGSAIPDGRLAGDQILREFSRTGG